MYVILNAAVTLICPFGINTTEAHAHIFVSVHAFGQAVQQWHIFTLAVLLVVGAVEL